MAGGRASIGRIAWPSGRRGLLAAVAAFVGVGLGKAVVPGRTEAAHTGSDLTVLHAGLDNNTTAYTSIKGTIANGPTLAATNSDSTLFLSTTDGVQGITGGGGGSAGVRGAARAASGATFGVYGESSSSSLNASGVKGRVFGGATNGVWGENSGTANSGTGVYGLASGNNGATVGVWGRTLSATNGAIGTLGQALAASGETFGLHGTSFSAQGAGVYGKGGRYGVLCETTTGNGVGIRARVDSGLGVFGSVEGNNGSGVYGESATGGYGVRGASNQGIGVYGAGGQYGVQAEQLVGSGVALRARATAGLGVYGSSGDANGSGVYGENLSGGYGLRGYSNAVGLYAQGGTRAAIFVGDVEIRGNLIGGTGAAGRADGAVRDGAAPAAPDDEARLVHDGRGRLVNGRGTVALSSGFQARADTSDYDVVLTPYGDCNGLYVAARTPAGFEVRELRGGTATLELGYRVSARAKPAAPGRSTDLGPGGAGVRSADGPAIVAPEIAPAWRDGGPRPDLVPPAWRDVPSPSTPSRGDEARD